MEIAIVDLHKEDYCACCSDSRLQPFYE
jgi:hypothetical protein